MQDQILNKFKKVLPAIQTNVLLKNYTTFKIGGPAKYFLIAENGEQIMKALTLAKQLQIPYFILGGGSNILASDKGFDGLVVKIQSNDKTFQKREVNQNIELAVNAGVIFADLVDFASEHGLTGLEWAGGLPGTFGGAIRGNAGAFGGETKDSITRVVALDNNLNIRELSNKECNFSYRSSVFKEKGWIVLSAVLTLSKGDKGTIKKIAQSNIDYRKEKHPLNYPNAGSIFKNCDLNKFSEKLKSRLSHVVKKDPFLVIPTAYLVSEAGLKGKCFGGAQISEKHPNFIVNVENAKAEDVLEIIAYSKKHIKEKYDVNLEQEIQFLES